MACLILLSNLPLTTNPGQESVYQCLLENCFKDEAVTTLVLEDVIQWCAKRMDHGSFSCTFSVV